jgi:hypothetical protein
MMKDSSFMNSFASPEESMSLTKQLITIAQGIPKQRPVAPWQQPQQAGGKPALALGEVMQRGPKGVGTYAVTRDPKTNKVIKYRQIS